jgi:CheY-like chemotaxis protein/anti-sigma regulatory factor (Ser/Thr protein kinase)
MGCMAAQVPDLTPPELEKTELERLKGTFLSNLSHELRTPLSGILGMVDLLLETKLDDEQQEYAAAARLCAEDLFHVVNATLEYSALVAGQLQLDETEFSLRAMLDSVVAQYTVRAQAKGLRLAAHFDPALPETMLGDATRIEELLLHLVDNAIKFTNHGSVTAALGRERDQLRITVQDTGIGIPADQRDRIFKSFEQGETGLSRNYAGVGLGLALVSELAALMNGGVEMESEPEAGSTFTLRLPLKPGAETHRPEEKERPAAGLGPRVLAVEDNPVGLMVLRHALKGRPVTVDTATDGLMALQAATEHQYDLILMDLQMPKMDGLQATAAIRELPGYRNIPILALTANYSDDVRLECQRHGMQGFLSKPIQASELWSAVSSHLQRTR